MKTLAKKLLVFRGPAPEGGKTPRASISHAEWLTVLGPLVEALGASLDAVVSGTLKVEHNRVTFLSVEPITGVTPIAYKPRRAPRADCDGWAEIWAWPVEVELVLP